ncbi:class I SAM-dependent methyltransferase [Phycisphaerales bacterium AB-hyl4]|uniref:Class I SAM-dependent methyltransferase n=1 Tax=Natronomicrosphaera hydrolytica TaxID=3242702 RepID=A0ABV4U909_9BACT
MAKRKKQKKTRNGTLTAKTADKYKLYQRAVQEPEHEVAFFDRVYRSIFGRTPTLLREDFCGTFAICCSWAKKRGRTAIGVDLDPEPLAWGREHNLAKLPEAARERVTIYEQDVRKVNGFKAEVLSAQNFSFWIFHTRKELLEYFKAAYRNIAKEGILVMDMMGGPECMEEDHTDERRFSDFTYVWEQARYNPITHSGTWNIHFDFDDGTRLNKAFTYDWRFWSIPEVRELLEEAGFSQSFVYWEGEGEKGEGDGVWRKTTNAPSDPAWIAYIVATK